MASNNNDLALGKYVIGKQSVVGDPRRKWEDRVHTSLIERNNDEPLLVGIVADGVGSADFGARGAQLAIDTVLSEFRNSRGSDIPVLIEHAIESANRVVYEDNQVNDGDGLSTLVVTVIHQDRCFVGNVGDSRAYWVRGEKKKILQLTRDHSYYNIYGGDPNASNAGVVVNAMGRKPEVQVDLGFYLEPGIEKEKAYRLGYAGVPLQPGDAIVLCSDGLIKDDPQGQPYIKTEEIVEAVQSEYEMDRAAIKLVSRVEGRRPDDNVSAVTLQCLTPEMIGQMKFHVQRTKHRQQLTRAGAGIFALVAVLLIGMLGYQLSQKRTEIVTVIVANTSAPTMTATQPINPGEARVDEVYGTGTNVSAGQYLKPGTEVITGDGGLRIVVGEQIGKAGLVYLFSQGDIQLNFTEIMKPVLRTGAVYIQPGSGSAEVYFLKWPELKATVSGSRMIVEMQGEDLWVYCFEGACQLYVGLTGQVVPVGSKQVYRTASGLWEDVVEMSYDEKWAWNIQCHGCLDQIVPSPTPTATPAKSQPTEKKKGDGDSGPSTPVPATISVPPTRNVPPTIAATQNVPPTIDPTQTVEPPSRSSKTPKVEPSSYP